MVSITTNILYYFCYIDVSTAVVTSIAEVLVVIESTR